MRVLVCLLIVGSVMMMSCSAELEVDSSLNNFVCLLPGLYIQAQQPGGDLPHDVAEEVGVPADVQKNIIQVIQIFQDPLVFREINLHRKCLVTSAQLKKKQLKKK